MRHELLHDVHLVVQAANVCAQLPPVQDISYDFCMRHKMLLHDVHLVAQAANVCAQLPHQ